MTESRVPAGVPTGGQFATSARAEGGVALAERPAPPASLLRACRAIDALQEPLDDLTDAVEERNLVDDALRACPEAVYVSVTPYYQGREDEARWEFRDHDERVIGSGFAPFRPSELDRVDEDGFSLDVAEVLERDFDAVIAKADDALIASLRERRPDVLDDTAARIKRAQQATAGTGMSMGRCEGCAADTPHVRPYGRAPLCCVCWN